MTFSTLTCKSLLAATCTCACACTCKDVRFIYCREVSVFSYVLRIFLFVLAKTDDCLANVQATRSLVLINPIRIPIVKLANLRASVA